MSYLPVKHLNNGVKTFSMIYFVHNCSRTESWNFLHDRTQHVISGLVFSFGMIMCSMSECLGDKTRVCSTLISLELLWLSLLVLDFESTIWFWLFCTSFRPPVSFWHEFLNNVSSGLILSRFPVFTAFTMSLAYSLREPSSLKGLSIFRESVDS